MWSCRNILMSSALLLLGFVSGCASFNPRTVEQTGPPKTTVRAVEREPESPEPKMVSRSPKSETRSSKTGDIDQKKLRELDVKEHVQTRQLKNSTVITIDSEILFDVRSAAIKKQAWPTLDQIAKFLVQHDERWILVAGHTDTLPTRTQQFPSNWELSALRAVNVVKYLSHMNGLNDARLIASGFGEHHPVASNKTQKGRQQNRRVEIHLLKDIFPDKQFEEKSS
jgi:chemotaxis protein MotB